MNIIMDYDDMFHFNETEANVSHRSVRTMHRLQKEQQQQQKQKKIGRG